jgi:hypothetical protein
MQNIINKNSNTNTSTISDLIENKNYEEIFKKYF